MIQQGQAIAQRLAAKLKAQVRVFFLPLILGALLAIAQRRTVPQWIRAAGLSEDYQKIFYHMRSIGRKHQVLFDKMLAFILEDLGEVLATARSIRLLIDETPTKRYSAKVE